MGGVEFDKPGKRSLIGLSGGLTAYGSAHLGGGSLVMAGREPMSGSPRVIDALELSPIGSVFRESEALLRDHEKPERVQSLPRKSTENRLRFFP
jgi:hypothetical protein